MHKIINKIFLVLVSFLLVTACDNDLDQFPTNIASSDSLEDYAGVLNAAGCLAKIELSVVLGAADKFNGTSPNTRTSLK